MSLLWTGDGMEKTRLEKVLDALLGAPRTRSEILGAVGGNTQKLDGILARLVAERRIVRVRTGLYALPGLAEH